MKSKYGFETSRERSGLMKKIRSRDTGPEIALRKLLWNAGIRYRKNVKKLPGSPDLVIRKYRIAIFIDGEFWHGHNWKNKKGKIKSNKEYWVPKIEKNIVRDSEANEKLQYLGYKVIRFWQHEIDQNPAMCYLKVMQEIENNNNN
ncbi:MAG: very short patch repair endonuclease [Prolixibacteraceae bacterium]|nr:very short patch repair endonuclease [Prolixibacteraceae bacterium]MBN2775468.1 very short patch repair endonuclease [Prolixibacteraceae bacterium]